jgi:lipopolysaccharide export LptBFGC system permease protein LptF
MLISFATDMLARRATSQALRRSAFSAQTAQDVAGKGIVATTSERRGLTRVARHAAWTYHFRTALPFATPLLASVALLLASRGGRTRRAAVMATCVLYFVIVVVAEALIFRIDALPPAAGAWLANAVFAGWILAARVRPRGVRGELASA